MIPSLRLMAGLEARAAERPGAPALTDHAGTTITRRAFAARVRALGRGLVLAGMQPGDHVLFAVRPGIDAIVHMIAIVEAGGVVVAADLGTGDELFAAQVAASRPRWVVAESVLFAASQSRLVRRLARARGVSLLPMHELRGARRVRVGRWLPGCGGSLSEPMLVRDRVADAPWPAMSDDAPAIVVFTSGTTAAPKGVVHSRRSIASTLGIIGSQLRFRPGDVLYSRDVHLILPALLAGARVVVAPSGAFSPERTVQRVVTHGVTHLFVVTAEAQQLASWLRARDAQLASCVRDVMIGAAPVRAEFLRGFQEVLPAGASAWCVYGMTELLPAAFVTLEDKLAFAGDGDLLGALAPGVRARIEQDELVVWGDNLFTGYLGGPVVHEHRSGDLAEFVGGQLVLRGRAKDMIIRGRYNIYPELHEPVIEQIAGVRRAAMVGVFSERSADEQVVLVVEPDAGVDHTELLERVHHGLRAGAHRIDDTALPDLVRVATLPVRGRSHKLDKGALREMARAWLQ